MTAMTPTEAAEALCPFARTFGLPQAQKGCHGPACALWRWEPIMADHPAFVAAIKAELAKRGFCGAGGKP